MKTKVTKELMENVITLREKGVSLQKIANILKMSESSCGRVVRVTEAAAAKNFSELEKQTPNHAHQREYALEIYGLNDAYNDYKHITETKENTDEYNEAQNEAQFAVNILKELHEIGAKLERLCKAWNA